MDRAYSRTRIHSRAAGFCRVYHRGFSPVAKVAQINGGHQGAESVKGSTGTVPADPGWPGDRDGYTCTVSGTASHRRSYQVAGPVQAGRLQNHRWCSRPHQRPKAHGQAGGPAEYSSARLSRALASVTSNTAHNVQRRLPRVAHQQQAKWHVDQQVGKDVCLGGVVQPALQHQAPRACVGCQPPIEREEGAVDQQ